MLGYFRTEIRHIQLQVSLTVHYCGICKEDIVSVNDTINILLLQNCTSEEISWRLRSLA